MRQFNQPSCEELHTVLPNFLFHSFKNKSLKLNHVGEVIASYRPWLDCQEAIAVFARIETTLFTFMSRAKFRLTWAAWLLALISKKWTFQTFKGLNQQQGISSFWVQTQVIVIGAIPNRLLDAIADRGH